MPRPFISLSTLLLLLATIANLSAQLPRPNILWITCEDIGPHLGCYGDEVATTPNLDRLAERSTRFSHAYSVAPVCAVARTAIIVGAYPFSIGAEHMRSMVPMPEGWRMYPELLREAGYYCTNVTKEDYNLPKPEILWDGQKRDSHWRNRPDPEQPFFAIFNFTSTHESQIRNEIAPENQIHDPASVQLPAYHPDLPEVRRNWAQYYDRIAMMDTQAGEILQQLEEDGLTENTIIFFYSDHGGPGMPRGKRSPHVSGLRVPMIIHVPETYASLAPQGYHPGGESDEIVTFIDLAPTLLSLSGLPVPDAMQGHAFMGREADPPAQYAFGGRGRMDERIDFVRTVTSGEYHYIRNYLPHLPLGQHYDYEMITPATRAWRSAWQAGELPPEQSSFWEPRPFEQLYHLPSDPDEVHNLADSENPEYQAALRQLRSAHMAHTAAIRDLGFIPEAEMHRLLARRDYKVSAQKLFADDKVYPFRRVFKAARDASDPDVGVDVLAAHIGDPNAIVRYWGVVGIRIRGAEAARGLLPSLRDLMKDKSSTVVVATAEVLARYGYDADREVALKRLLHYSRVENGNPPLVVQALNAIDQLDGIARPVLADLEKVPLRMKGPMRRVQSDAPERIIKAAKQDL